MRMRRTGPMKETAIPIVVITRIVVITPPLAGKDQAEDGADGEDQDRQPQGAQQREEPFPGEEPRVGAPFLDLDLDRASDGLPPCGKECPDHVSVRW